MDSYTFVNVTDFTPNLGQWTSIGNWSSYTRTANSFAPQVNPGPVITFLSPTVFRVRFNPTANYSTDNSYAVINRNLGTPTLTVTESTTTLEIDTTVIRVVINKSPYALSVYRGNQLIHADTSSYNMVYIPGQEVVANFKVYPANALYFGLGEKAGATLARNDFSMTFFNYDNFIYASGPLPPNEQGGPLNPTEPLYCSVPFLIETNPNPTNGARYSYGIFFDNPSQSYVNIGVDGNTGMFGKYYFGALYGDLDYYFIYGDEVPDIVQQYGQLTGYAPMPPKYVFGYHQGCYGYYTEDLLVQAASSYRAAQIPCDGLHIDVDFQDNYRTFTSSNLKFPNVDRRCSTTCTAAASSAAPTLRPW